MSTNPPAEVSQRTQPVTPPPSGSSTRLVILLVLLVIAIGALGFDYGVAGPGIDAADEKIQKHVDESNRKSVKDGTRVTPDEIRKLLGRQPTWVEKHPDEQYEIEYYCWWGPVPVLNMRRHYLTVVYVGDEPRHYTSHYKNEMAPIEALPIQHTPAEVTDEQVPPPTSSSEGKETEGKRKRKAKGAESTGTEAKAADASPADAEGAKPQGGKESPPKEEEK